MGFIGSGRHRRPTQTERAVSAAGVAGAGLAIPLLAATSAHAAPVTTWDAVAQCASAGDWSRATGNGSYGGLQLDLDTWVAYGGSSYGASPDHATKDEQIAVAERVLADRGARTWGSCATTAGLTGEGRPEAAEPTATAPATPAPTASTTATGRSRSAAPVFPGMQGRDANGIYWYQVDGAWYWTTSQAVYESYTAVTASPSAPTTATPGTVLPGTDAGTPTAPVTTAPAPTDGTGTLPGTGTAPTTPTPTTDAPTTGAPTTGLPTTDGTAPATGTDPSGTAESADPGAPATTVTEAPPAAEPDTYTVAPGDTLSAISADHRLGGWKNVYSGNSTTIGEDPDLIKPGQVLTIG
ncbi:transglycosylase family protein [Kitasatospora sp. NBC_01539]|uniref:LysM peptidoglycan-binding domain-containing protein n=1 Tax=Kitasatospora sp. NBC_01539 TaxID=2903577 RepID=UPI003860155A